MMYQRVLVRAPRPRLAKAFSRDVTQNSQLQNPLLFVLLSRDVWAFCLSSCVHSLFGCFRANLRMMQNLGKISVPAKGTAGHWWAASPNARWAPAKVRSAPELGFLEGFLFLHARERNFITATSAAPCSEAVHWADRLGSCLSLSITAQVQSPWRSEGVQDLTENHKN